MRYGRPGNKELAVDVDGEGPHPILRRDFLERCRGSRDAGIVDDDVEAAHGLGRIVYETGGRRCIGNVANLGADARQAFGGRSQIFLGEIADPDAGARAT